jgi:predicted nucleotidyltransferase
MPSADRPEDSAQSERKTASGSAAVDREIEAFVDAASRVLGSDLRSIVLFGSAAEGKLRATSDVNVVLVLSAFDPAKVDSLREPLRTAHAAVRLSPMILLESEIPSAAEAFAEKFSDILRRRRVLHGSDPFAGVSIPRSAAIGRLRQVLLNLVLRLREQYVLKSLREEQTAHVVADTAGPLRSAAAALFDLEGTPASSPKEALRSVVLSFGGTGWSEVLDRISEARESGVLPAGVAGPTLLSLIEIAERLRKRAESLS